MFHKYTLKNGIKVITAPLRETKAVTVLVLVKVGSRYETRRINGASHFVEHLMFKGTKRRPNTLSISKELDSIGAEYNAFTSKDHTGYYIKTNYDKIDLALDMLSDILFNSKFDPREIEKERGVIIEEINMYEDNPIMTMEDFFEETMFGNQPIGWNIAGPKSVIRKVSRQQLYSYYHTHYRPRNMLIAVAGRINGNINTKINKYFNQPARSSRSGSFRKISSVQRRPQLAVKYKDTEQVQLGLGFPAYSYCQSRLYPLYLLSTIMGGNMSSRLFISIREKKGLCYFIRTNIGVYEDTGTLMIQAGLDKKRIKPAIKAILAELKKMRERGITVTELINAKEYLKGKLVLDLEASDNVASWFGKQALLQKKTLTPAEQIAKLETVTRSEVWAVARELIKDNKLNLALIGPFEKSTDFQSILKI